jgi:membrane protein involved in colicin uptake
MLGGPRGAGYVSAKTGALVMKVLRVAALTLLLTGPAYAQMQTPNINLIPDMPSKTPEEQERDAARDKAYKESLKKIPDAKGSTDPWGGVRSDAPKNAPAKSTAAAKAKTKAETKTEAKTGSNAPN